MHVRLPLAPDNQSLWLSWCWNGKAVFYPNQQNLALLIKGRFGVGLRELPVSWPMLSLTVHYGEVGNPGLSVDHSLDQQINGQSKDMERCKTMMAERARLGDV